LGAARPFSISIVNIFSAKQNKQFADFIKMFVAGSIIRRPSMGSCEVPQQIWGRSFQPF